MYVDSFGCVQSGGDGGDTCHRMFTMHFRLLLQFKLAIEKGTSLPPVVHNISKLIQEKGLASGDATMILLKAENGIFRRHPNPDFWGSDPNNLSRDQMIGLICFIAFLATRSGDLGKRFRKELRQLLWACLKRGMFAQNIYPNWVDARKDSSVKKKTPDLLPPDVWGLFARGFTASFAAPLAIPFILLGDLFLVLSVVMKLWAPINKDGTFQFRLPQPDDVDDDNMHNSLMLSQHVCPTPMSWLARKLFKRFRQKNLGNTQYGEKDPMMGALMYYHRGPDGNPELAELARKLTESY
jgi:hypothetical protein